MIEAIITVARRDVSRWINTMIHPVYNWALISMYGDEGPLITKNNMEKLRKLDCKKALSLWIHDITDSPSQEELAKSFPGKKFSRFSEKHANAIIGFVTETDNKNIKTLVVQCGAGVSRSGAVALWACRFFGMDEEKFRLQNRNIMPNFYILGMLRRLSGMTYAFKQEIEKRTDKTDSKIILI